MKIFIFLIQVEFQLNWIFCTPASSGWHGKKFIAKKLKFGGKEMYTTTYTSLQFTVHGGHY